MYFNTIYKENYANIIRLISKEEIANMSILDISSMNKSKYTFDDMRSLLHKDHNTKLSNIHDILVAIKETKREIKHESKRKSFDLRKSLVGWI